jgi:hypothetical protein
VLQAAVYEGSCGLGFKKKSRFSEQDHQDRYKRYQGGIGYWKRGFKKSGTVLVLFEFSLVTYPGIYSTNNGAKNGE